MQNNALARGSVGWTIVLYTKKSCGLIPSQGTNLGYCSIRSRGVYGRLPRDVSLSLPFSVCKNQQTHPWVRIKKHNTTYQGCNDQNSDPRELYRTNTLVLSTNKFLNNGGKKPYVHQCGAC